MKRSFFLIMFTMLFLSTTVMALGIVPGKIIIPFSPLREEAFTFEVFGPKSVKAETDCIDIITINRTIKASGDNRAKVLAHVKLPERMEPGSTRCGIKISEFAEEGQQLGVAVNIIGVIQIDVPFPGRYAILNLNAENAMPDQDLRVSATITNLGTDELDAQADIIIKDYKNDTVKLKKTDSHRLQSKESREFYIVLKAGTLESGKYMAKAIYDYGAGITSGEKPFIIGQLNLELNNYTKELKSESISPFSVTVSSLWGNPLENVFAEINLFDKDGIVLLNGKTPSTTIGPYSTEIIDSFLDTNQIGPGNYSGEIILHSRDKDFSNKVEFIVMEKKSLILPTFYATPYAFLLIILAIIVTDIVYMRMLKKKYSLSKAGSRPSGDFNG